MFSQISKLNLLIILTLVLMSLNFEVSAESSTQNLKICESIEEIDKKCQTISQKECQDLLKTCQDYLEEKSSQIEKDIAKTEKEKKTLKNEVSALKKKIENLDYQIRQSNLTIKDLGFQIKDTESSIGKTSNEIEDSKQKLGGILRTIYEEGQKSLIEILLSEDKLSDFFDNLVALEALNNENQKILEDIKNLKSYLEGQKESLDEEKQNFERLAEIQMLQRQDSQETKKKQEYFLQLTEAEYQKYIKEKKETEKRTADIRARLFELIGVPEGGVPFEKAVELANLVSARTNIRPAFLLAVLVQETRIGRAVGNCNWQDKIYGRDVMSKNQQPLFSQICSELGYDSNLRVVSCPLCINSQGNPVSCFGCQNCSRPSWSWGGAMGPAQFIPSTWNLFKDQVRGIIGKMPDPWKPLDSFWAAGFLLKDCGATTKEYQDEKKAAVCYFAGWGNRNNPSYQWHGKTVMSWAGKIQTCIDSNYQSCEGLPF